MTKIRIVVLVSLLVSLCLALQLTVLAQKLKTSQTPAAVQKTIKDEEGKGATLKGLSKETENGATQYEAEFMLNGKTHDMIINKDGSIAEVEDAVDLASLSPAVQETIKKNAGANKIVAVEAMTKGGSLALYEVIIQKGAKKSEFQVSTDGNLIPKAKKK